MQCNKTMAWLPSFSIVWIAVSISASVAIPVETINGFSVRAIIRNKGRLLISMEATLR